MESYDRKSNNDLKFKLIKHGHKFDFFQAVKILEALHPNNNSVGTGSNPDNETIRFSSHAGLSFAASDINEIVKQSDNQSVPYKMIVNFLGLAGSTGPLPLKYTELVLKRIQKKDFAFRDFLDIYHHRIISLLYKSAKKHRVHLNTISPEKTDIARYVFSLIGIDYNVFNQFNFINKRLLLSYAPLFFQRCKNLSNLELLLSDFFQVQVKGKQFCGSWFDISDDELSKIGTFSGINNTIGKNVIIGKQSFSRQSKVELIIGPLTIQQYRNFLPSGRAFKHFLKMVRFYIGKIVECDISLILLSSEIPEVRFENTNSIKLGWTSFITTNKALRKNVKVKIYS